MPNCWITFQLEFKMLKTIPILSQNAKKILNFGHMLKNNYNQLSEYGQKLSQFRPICICKIGFI
jgi:hypothetical protein